MTQLNSTYDVLMHFCKDKEISIRFYPKYSSELYPDFSFGSEDLIRQLFTPIGVWFRSGSGTFPWSEMTLVFSVYNDSLGMSYRECVIDEEYYDPDDEYEYLLDVERLKDGKVYHFEE